MSRHRYGVSLNLFKWIDLYNFLELSGMSEDKKEWVEKTVVKKEHSYTYWVDEKNRSRELPQEHRPKKIQKPVTIPEAPANGPSTWNSLGSWEQRTVPVKELNQSTSDAIKQWLADGHCELALTEVELEGEFKQIFSNNKKKILYELSGSIKFQGDDLKIKIKELTCSGDQEYQIKGKKKQQRQKLQAVAQKIINAVVEALNRYKQ